MSIENRTLALAGMFQSADLVRQIARQGLLDIAPFEASITSLLQLDADSTEAVYGGLSGLKTGLQVLCGQLGTGTKRDMEVMHYLLGMVFLERKLSRHDGMLEKIKVGIEEAVKQTEMYAMTDPNIIAQLAYLYTQTLSTLDYRIKVNGERRFLENQNNAHKIRALLLSGIRSAVLWQQKGGKRLQLIFSRGKILRSAQQSLERLKSHSANS
ncbi:MAG: lysogenization regulator HflD [Candidatus Parabeggiatoa sp. nov. 3]|nr:MAG: lysogenization regulator HflD [Gammaproteobacteria bacterium]RKZ73465.1 MAG: lysogenization regulator HflD [Gammaproteobacteria bacterium]